MVMRRHPWAEFTRLFDEMDRAFGDTIDGGRSTPFNRGFRPAIDLYDTGQELIVHALLPGTRPEDLDVNLEQNTLHISGSYGYEHPEEQTHQWNWYRREIGSGQFTQSVALPAPVDSEQIEAHLEWGVLTLRMPKAEQARTRRIEISQPKALSSEHQG
ncbi:MAG: Hsp20/alpha crystallin family protein [Sphaerobacteraceae bacterium]|nr:MAG: Hsp20/alpha crystallin family protein [Sphaerobacteraceae bacterium]